MIPRLAWDGVPPRIPTRWVYVFATWIALILPLFAFGVAFMKGGKDVVLNDPAQLRWDGTQQAAQFVRLAQQIPAFRAAALSGADASTWNVISVAPQDSHMVVIAAQRDLLLTRDGGQTWVHIANVLPQEVDAFAISPQTEAVMYAHIQGRGFYTTMDGGSSWQISNR